MLSTAMPGWKVAVGVGAALVLAFISPPARANRQHVEAAISAHRSRGRQQTVQQSNRDMNRQRGSAGREENSALAYDASKVSGPTIDARQLAGGAYNPQRLAGDSFRGGRVTGVEASVGRSSGHFGNTAHNFGGNFTPSVRTTNHHERVFQNRPSGGHRYDRPSWHHSRWYHHYWPNYSIIWPTHHDVIYYGGPHAAFGYVYPRYHRKYVFVSIGGYWPMDYTYSRYYWYGYHPYRWYGADPVVYEISGPDNYYTYDYTQRPNGPGPTAITGSVESPDYEAFAAVREKLAQQKAKEPAKETDADKNFDEAVKAFADGRYNQATDKFSAASEMEPNDVVVPFAYVQALFAGEQYTRAAQVLRRAVAKLPEDKKDVFYPRGLYSDQGVLNKQVDALAKKAEIDQSDGDLQLLLGYQLLGLERFEEARPPLERAAKDSANGEAAGKLIGLLERTRTDASKQ